MTMIMVWLGRQVIAGKIGDGEIRAAGEIVRVALLGREAGTVAIPVMDLTRIKVDGGRAAGHRLYGQDVDPALTRWMAYLDDVAGRPASAATLGGEPVPNLLVSVLTGCVGWRTTDVRLRVRNGRTIEMVVRELKRYAALHNFGT